MHETETHIYHDNGEVTEKLPERSASLVDALVMRFQIEYKINSTGGVFTTYADNLADVKDGFWVTKDCQLTKASDNHAFILPHMIRYILKL